MFSSYYVFVVGSEKAAMCAVEGEHESGVINVICTSMPYCPGSHNDTDFTEKAPLERKKERKKKRFL